MYQNFYGLNDKPFHIIPNPNYFYLSSKHENALTYIEYGLMEDAGFILLTGEIGTGKTTLIRYLLNQIEADIDIAVIFNTNVSPDQLLSLILQEFEIDFHSSNNKTQKLDKLYNFLIDQYAKGKKALLIVDEAQNLSDTALEEIRLLSNLQTDNKVLLQILLAGQPQLRSRLEQPNLQQFAQRIVVNYHLTALSKSEVEKYIIHRLHRAGCKSKIFTKSAINQIYQISKGVPRIINQICDTSLVYGFADELNSIDVDTIQQVCDERNGMGITTEAESRSVPLVENPSSQSNNIIIDRLNMLESKIKDIQTQLDYFLKDGNKLPDKYKNRFFNNLKELLFLERERNSKLLIEYSQLKSDLKTTTKQHSK